MTRRLNQAVSLRQGWRTYRARWRQDWPWWIAAFLVAGMTLAPLLSIIILAVSPQSEASNAWSHFLGQALVPALRDTTLLLCGVAIVTTLLGVGASWLVTAYRFAGRDIFVWALLLPLAVPTYIVAYSHVEIFDYFGPVQTTLRTLFNFKTRTDYWFPELRSLGGAIFLMSFVLYPYVYLTTRAMFSMQSSCVLEVARTLGSSRWQSFSAIALPLARPAVVLGLMLALIEAMNDIGAVEYLGVRTLTASIYSTWLNRGNLAGAAQLACVAMAFVFIVAGLERWARRHHRHASQAQRERRLSPIPLKGGKAAAAFLFCSLPVTIGFILPALFLLRQAIRRTNRIEQFDEFWVALGHTVLLAAVASLLAVGCGLLLLYGARVARAPFLSPLVRLSGLNYAVPGTVFALAVLIPIVQFDNWLSAILRIHFGIALGLILSGSAAALVLAYMARYLVIASSTLEAGLSKVSPHLDMAARSLGRGRVAVLREVHMPLIRPAVVAAYLLVLVDTMKELPVTLLLRPFNFETLATLVYAQASRGQFEDGALAALAIVAAGLVPVILLSHMGRSAEILTGRTKIAQDRRQRSSHVRQWSSEAGMAQRR